MTPTNPEPLDLEAIETQWREAIAGGGHTTAAIVVPALIARIRHLESQPPVGTPPAIPAQPTGEELIAAYDNAIDSMLFMPDSERLQNQTHVDNARAALLARLQSANKTEARDPQTEEDMKTVEDWLDGYDGHRDMAEYAQNKLVARAAFIRLCAKLGAP